MERKEILVEYLDGLLSVEGGKMEVEKIVLEIVRDLKKVGFNVGIIESNRDTETYIISVNYSSAAEVQAVGQIIDSYCMKHKLDHTALPANGIFTAIIKKWENE